MTGKVRILRVLEYEGSRDWVEDTVINSIHGERNFGYSHGIENVIRGATLGEFPTILEEKSKLDQALEVAQTLSIDVLNSIIESKKLDDEIPF